MSFRTMEGSARSPFRAILLSAFISIATVAAARADHGPGTSGGGSSVGSGEVMKPGSSSLSLRWDFTRYEDLSAATIEQKALEVKGEGHAHFDALNWASVVTGEFAYGVTERFQISFATGLYRADDVREGHREEDGSTEFHQDGDISGVTDLWLSGKYRILKGPYGSWAANGGVKLPTGRDDVRSEETGEKLEQSMQPGSGTFDFLLGTAYSVWLRPRVTLDASFQYTIRTANDNFQMGDRIDSGVAVAYRFFDDAKAFPQWSLYGEATVRHLYRNTEEDMKVSNSGGTVLFLAPGVRCSFTERFSAFFSPRFPVLQDLNDPQQRTLLQVSTGLSIGF